MTFNELNLIAPLLKAIQKKGYSDPTPIQIQSIPHLLKGNDIFGCAQTGTGKTASFALPILQLIDQHKKDPANTQGIKALILAPTRELALQINESFAEYGKFLPVKHTVIFGGVSQVLQLQVIKKGIDILIATPGRLIDLMQQGYISLSEIKYFVLDEADRMFDMGFITDIKKIISKLPAKKQNMLFSATVPPEVKKLADNLLQNPVLVSVNPVSSPTELVKQSLFYVSKENKRNLLLHVLQSNNIHQALVFTRTKRGADKIAKELKRNGFKADSIHGDKSQAAREKALNGFKSKLIHILVATDIASRGIDVEKLSHVINFEIPEVAETYVHRIGRTGRAGELGNAITFCTQDEVAYLQNIHKLTKKKMDVINKHPFIEA